MLSFAPPALAQEAAEDADRAGDQEIVVAGIRQAYRGDFGIREIPQAIGIIGSEQLEDNNITDLTAALDLNASVARQNNFGGLWDSYAVRGFTGDTNQPSGYLVNGFNAGRGFGGPRDIAGVERIEILKGPNAALFGRGEPGGTVNIVTKRALFGSNRGEVSASYGSFDSVRADADVNLALGETAAVRLIGFFENADSFRDTVKSESFGFLPSVGIRLGPDTVLSYDLELTRKEVPFDRGVVAIDGELGLIPNSRFLGEPGDGPMKANATGHQLQLQHEFNADWTFLGGGSYRQTSLEGFSSDPELAASRQPLFRDGRSLARQRRYRDYDAQHAVLRAEVAGDFSLGGLRNRLLIGADYDRFEYDQSLLRYRPPPLSSNPTEQASNIIDIFLPVYGRFPLPQLGPQTDRTDRQTAYGIYLQDQISLTDSLQIRIGGRFDEFSLLSRNNASGAAQSRSFDRFSPQFGIVWEASRALSVYAAYGEGFRSNIGADAAGRVFDPETSKSFEVGTKFALLKGALTGTFAAFELRKGNVLAADPGNPGFSLPIGEAGSRGVELDVQGRLPRGFELLLSYAFIDAEVREDVIDSDLGFAILAGDPLLNIPRHNLNVQLANEVNVAGRPLRVGAGVHHVGERLGETGADFHLPAYTLVRAFANWRPHERLELFAEANNLLDEVYYPSSYSALWIQPGAPRTASAGVRLQF
nr:TonB-dependent siderophore receptor [Altericroceibacterium xinjiangense]